MARRVFFSFHFKADSWRASQVRNAGAVEGNEPVSDNDWEAVKRGGDAAIQKWIDGQLSGRSCVVVLIGSATAGRKWVNYEIKKAWDDGKGVLGIYIHHLLDQAGDQSTKGANPFDSFKVGDKKMSSIVKAYDPPYTTSTKVHSHIKANLASWVEDAIRIRSDQ